MEFKEFVLSVEKKFSLTFLDSRPYFSFSRKEIESMSDKELSNLVMQRNWFSRGMQGGNCYSNEADIAVEGSTQEDINPDLASVVELLAPDITVLKYFSKIQPLIKYTEVSQFEYYGNYSVYTRVYVNLKELYDVLIEIKK